MTKIAERFARLPERTRKWISNGSYFVVGIIGGIVSNSAPFSEVLAVLAVLFVIALIIGTYRRWNTVVSEPEGVESRVPAPHPESRAGRGQVMTSERDAVASTTTAKTTDGHWRDERTRGLIYTALVNVLVLGLFVINGVLADGWPRWVLLISAAASAVLLTIAEVHRRPSRVASPPSGDGGETRTLVPDVKRQSGGRHGDAAES